MTSIFNNTGAIQVNQPWTYDESNYKWTIDENDVIEHVELSQEITQDFIKLDQYNVALEEACDKYNTLINQYMINNDLLDNHKITLEHVSLSNECLSICKAQLGYDVTVNRSNESDMTNYERLTVSNEDIKEFLKDIWEKIKAIFKKVYDFIKGIIVKLLKWLGFYKDDVTKKANTIKSYLNTTSTESFIEEISETYIKFNKALNKLPLSLPLNAFKELIEKNDLLIFLIAIGQINNFSEVLDTLDLTQFNKQFSSNNYDKFLNALIKKDNSIQNFFGNQYKNIAEMFKNAKSYYSNGRLNTENGNNKLIFITKMITDNIEDSVSVDGVYLDSNNNYIYGKLKLFKDDLNLDMNVLVSKLQGMMRFKPKDFDRIFDNYLNSQRDLKLIELNIKNLYNRIEKNIQKLNAEDITNEEIRTAIDFIKNLGTHLPTDILAFYKTYETTVIKTINIFYKYIENREDDAMEYYKASFEQMRSKFPKLKLKGISKFNGKPCYEIGESQVPACVIQLLFPSDNGKNEKLVGVICLNPDILEGKAPVSVNIRSRLDLLDNIADEMIKTTRLYGIQDNENIVISYLRKFEQNSNKTKYRFLTDFISYLKSFNINCDFDMLKTQILTSIGNIIDMYIHYNDALGQQAYLTKKEAQCVYYHELGHVYMRQPESEDNIKSHHHINTPIEIEADCYGMIMSGMSVQEMADLRLNKLSLEINITSEQRRKYIKTLVSMIPKCLKWSSVDEIKRSKFNFLLKTTKNNFK